jgi:hypothetical protein
MKILKFIGTILNISFIVIPIVLFKIFKVNIFKREIGMSRRLIIVLSIITLPSIIFYEKMAISEIFTLSITLGLGFLVHLITIYAVASDNKENNGSYFKTEKDHEYEKFKLLMLEELGILNNEEKEKYREEIGDIRDNEFDSFDTFSVKKKYYNKFIFEGDE